MGTNSYSIKCEVCSCSKSSQLWKWKKSMGYFETRVFREGIPGHTIHLMRGFVEAHADDGFLEIFGLKHGWHASMVMVELISAKHIAQASSIRFELRGGEWTEAYMQMDGEPWKQPMNKEFSTFVEIKRVPFQSVMVHGE